MTETYTGGSVKISCPSNYAENRRGGELTLHFCLPEGTTCEQADEATRRVRVLCLKHVIAAQSENITYLDPPFSPPSTGSSAPTSTASSATELSPAPAPATTAEAPRSRAKPKPSEITIGGTAASTTMPPTADASAPSAPTPAPVVAAPTAPLPAQPTPAFVMPGVSPSIPASTGTGGGSGPFANGGTAAAPGASIPGTTAAGSPSSLGMPGPTVMNGASPSNPTVPAPVVAASLSAVEASDTAGGGISAMALDDLSLRKLVAREITRINQLAPGQGGNVVNSITADFVAPPGGLLSIPQADRERFVATLAAWHGGTA